MPQPTNTNVHIDRPLSTISLAQMQGTTGYVAGDVFPIIPVEKQSDQYYTWPRNPFARDDVKERAPGDTVNRVGYTLSTDNYYCRVKAIGHPIPDQTRANADAGVDLDLGGQALITSQMLQHMERIWASQYFIPGVWGTAAVGGLGLGTEVTGVTSAPSAGQFRRWDDYVNSTPIRDLRTAIRAFQRQSGGIKPNRLVVSAEVFDALVDHPLVVDRFKYTSDRSTNAEMLARLIGIERIVVCEAVGATNVEGAAEAYGFIQGKHALLTYRPDNPGLMTPMAGAMFVWSNLDDTGIATPIKRWRDEAAASDVMELQTAFDPKVTSKSLGYFFATAIS